MCDFDTDSSFEKEEEEETEEGELYQWIFEMNHKADKEKREEVQSPSRSEQELEHMTDAERSAERTEEAGTSSGAVSKNYTREWRPKWRTYLSPASCLTGGQNPQENPRLGENTARKPWRDPGVDITDYFNYGFDEDSWNRYCKKNRKLHAANKIQRDKTKVQKKRHCTHNKRKPGCASSSSSSSGAHRLSDGVSERHSWPRREEEKALIQNFFTSFLPTSSPSDPSNPQPRDPHRRRLPLYRSHTSDSENSEPLYPSTSRSPHKSGGTSLIPKKRAHCAGVNKSAKSWGHFQLKEECEDELGYYDRYENRSKGREREKTSSACSRKEQKRRREKTKPGQTQLTSENSSRGKEGRVERRHREREDRWEESSHRESSRSKGEAGEVKDRGASNPKRRRGKNKNKAKKETFTADEERKLQSE